MKNNTTLPDVSWLPFFDWVEKWDEWISTSDINQQVDDIVAKEKIIADIPSKEDHFSNSYVNDEEGIKVWFNFTSNWTHFQLLADVNIENRMHGNQLFDISRVPHLENVRVFRGYDKIGYCEIEDTSFLNLASIKSQASIFFFREYLWKNEDSKVA